jgi:Phage portal protein, SPP1 Gp6-like
MTASVAESGALVEQLAKLDGGRLRSYRENLAFYQGQQWPASPRRRERRLVFNYAKAVIDKVASYLMSGVSFVVDAEDASEQAQERARRSEAALRDVFEANNLAQLDFDSEIDASILGDGVYKVTWDADERRVRVSAPDVQGIYAWWLGDDVSRIWRVASRYFLSPDEASMLYGSRPSGKRAVAASRGRHAVVEVWTQSRFELCLDGALLESKANPYGFIPFVIYPNLREPKRDTVLECRPRCPRRSAAQSRRLASILSRRCHGHAPQRAL